MHIVQVVKKSPISSSRRDMQIKAGPRIRAAASSSSGADAETALAPATMMAESQTFRDWEHLTGKGAETGIVENVQLAALKSTGIRDVAME